MARPKQNILVIDVGGTHVKVLDQKHTEMVTIDSGPDMTPAEMVRKVRKATADWSYTAITVGYPGPVVRGRPNAEPHNLACGWVDFRFEEELEHPVRVVNDAAMQALGSYEGGRMLFLGLGTGLGAALILDGVLEPMEIAHLPYRKGRTYEDYLGLRGIERMGKSKWRKHTLHVIELFRKAFEVEYVVLGGGNARLIKEMPDGIRPGANSNAFAGGFRVWTDYPQYP